MLQTRAGGLKERVTLEERMAPAATDGWGGQIETWQTLFENRFARIDPGKGAEFERHKQRVPEMTHLVTMRLLPAVSEVDYQAMRIVWHTRHGDRTLRIVGPAIDRDNDGREILLTCTEEHIQ